MNWAKRGLSLILIVLMLVSCLPMAAFAAISTDYSAKVTVEKSANESYNGQDVAKVSFIANANGQKVGNGCSVLLAYDPDVFELLELSEDDGSIIGKMETSTETWSTDIGYNIMVEVLQRFTPKANACMSADGETAYLMLQPMRMGSGSIISEDTVLMAAYLGLADGVSWDAIPSNAIRMGTVEERNTLNQSAIAVLNDGDKTNYIYGFKNGNDTLAKPEVVPVGYTPVKPAYTGTEAAASEVASKQGGNVTLKAQTIEGENVEYGYSTRQGEAPSAWQDAVAFTDIPAGTAFFWARVKATDAHQAGKPAASQPVTIYAAPAISYGAIPDMTIDAPITPLSPTVENEGAGAADNAYTITEGALPAGLAVDAATGAISGAPTAAGEAGQVTVTYTDAEGQTATATVRYGAVNKIAGALTISCADVAYGSLPAPEATENTSGGEVTYAYSTDADGTFGPWDTANPVGTYYVKGTAAATDKYGETESNVASFQVTAAAISGSVAVSGTPAYGQTLTAQPSGVPGTPAYQWYRDGAAIEGAEQSTYKLTTADVGCAISVKVSDKSGNYAGTVDSEGTDPVSKAMHTGTVAGNAAVVSSTYDKAPATAYTYDLSGLTGLPADLEGMGYGTVAVASNGDGLIAADPAPTLEGGKLAYTVAPKEAGKSAVITVVLTSDNYQDITASITVTAVDKQPADIGLEDVTVTYNGQAHTASPVWPEAGTGSTARTVTYTKDGAPVSEPKDAGTYTVSAVYENDTHYGSATATLIIQPLEAQLAWSGDAGLVYDGAAKNITAAVSNLVKGDTCAVTVEGGTETNAGEHTATAVHLDNPNYALPAVVTHNYTIAPRAVDLAVTLEPAEFEFNGSVQAPSAVTVKDGDKTLTAETAYTVSIPADTSAVGTYTVTVAGVGNYEGSKGSAEYAITKVSQAALTIDPTGSKTYGDAPFTITVAGGSSDGAYSLASSDPSILSLEPGEAAGTWTAAIRKAGKVTLTAGKAEDNNYKPAQCTAELTVDPKALTEGSAALPQGFAPIYSGSAFEPEITVKDGETVLVKDADYTVTYADNINAGQATVTAAGLGNYAGTITMHFTIAPRNLAGEGVALSGLPKQIRYTGQAIAPQITVKDGETILAKDADYTVAYADNTDVGIATVTVTGKGNYQGTASATFEIAAAAVNGVATIGGADYNVGTELTVSVSGRTDSLSYQWYRNGAPIENAASDKYTLTEADANAQITVTVTSAGNYAGTLESAPITVGKAALTGTLTLSNAEGVITAAVEGAPEGSCDIVWLRDGQPISGAAGTAYTITDEDRGHTISAKLTAKEDYTGEISGTGAVEVPAAAPGQPVLTASAGDGRVTVSWTAADNGSSIYQYQVQLDDGPVITVDGSVTSYTFTGLTNGQAYTVNVTAINAQGSTAASVEATPKASSSGGGSGVETRYTITVEQSEGGAISPASAQVAKGESKTFTITASEGYQIADVFVDGKSIGAVSTYTFENVRAKHTISARFEQTAEGGSVAGFTDVKPTDWFAEAVQYAVDGGLMNGTSATTFSPSGATTRGMIVTILYRQAGSPAVESDGKAWWSDARAWAMANGISDGTHMDMEITREQLATMLYRYAELTGGDVSRTASLEGFEDSGRVSAYAVDALKWAAAEGIVTGKTGGIIDPQAGATRAETATMFMRFRERNK